MLNTLNLSTFKNIEIVNNNKCRNHQYLTMLVMLTLLNVYMNNVDKDFESKHCTFLHFKPMSTVLMLINV